MCSAVHIDYRFYPHIIEDIVSYADYKTKLRWRATCRALQRFTDNLLLKGVVHIDFDGLWERPAIVPYTGTSYPFFKLDGDRPALQRRLQKEMPCYKIRDIDPDVLENLLAKVIYVVTVRLDHHSRKANYRFIDDSKSMVEFAAELDWRCSCDQPSPLYPALHHEAWIVYIVLHADDNLPSSTRRGTQAGEEEKEIDVAEGDVSQCHVLRHILTERVKELYLTIYPPLSLSSIDHLPAYVFPNASTMTLHPALGLKVTLSVPRLDHPDIKENIRSAFARHLRIGVEMVIVLLNGESWDGQLI